LRRTLVAAGGAAASVVVMPGPISRSGAGA
jgi:hypothetical protein